jgi:hypothetical protein
VGPLAPLVLPTPMAPLARLAPLAPLALATPMAPLAQLAQLVPLDPPTAVAPLAQLVRSVEPSVGPPVAQPDDRGLAPPALEPHVR